MFDRSVRDWARLWLAVWESWVYRLPLRCPGPNSGGPPYLAPLWIHAHWWITYNSCHVLFIVKEIECSFSWLGQNISVRCCCERKKKKTSINFVLFADQQRQIFQPPPSRIRKCVVATNIAATSLTINGIKWARPVVYHCSNEVCVCDQHQIYHGLSHRTDYFSL